MSIIRTEHNKNNPYVLLNKTALEDKNLSWAAKGLWSYLMSRPDNWNVSVAHLSSIYCDKNDDGTEKRGGGEKAIYSLLNELIEKGYCERVKVKNEKGHFDKTEYIIIELKNKVPRRPERDVDERDAVQPDAVKGDTNKEGVLRSNECLTKKQTNNKENPPPASVVVDFIFSEEEKEQLKSFTPEQIDQAKKKTNTDCIQKANHSRVKFFFKVLTALPPPKKPSLTPYEELSQHFKNGESYNNAECIINPSGIAFTRGMKQDQLGFNKFWKWDNFFRLCDDFGIKYSRS